MTMFSGNHTIFVGVMILTHRHTHSRSFKPNSPGDLSQLDLDRLVRTVLWRSNLGGTLRVLMPQKESRYPQEEMVDRYPLT